MVSDWLVREPDGNLDIRYILYDHEMSERKYEQLLVWAARDLKLKAVRLILIVAKRAGKRLNIESCAAANDMEIFITERATVKGHIPALFACVTNLGKMHDLGNLCSVFTCLLEAKANPYQTVYIKDDEDFEVRTCVREYLENILEESKVTNVKEIQTEAESILRIIDREDKSFMTEFDREDKADIYNTRDEIIFAEDVERAADGKGVAARPEKKRRESVFGKVKRRVWDGLSRKPRRSTPGGFKC